MEQAKQQTQPSGGPIQEGESSSLPELPPEPFADSKNLEISQDSESNTEILTPESSHSGPAEDPDVPPLRRTDSILITKEYLESIAKVSNVSESSMSSIEIIDDEYTPPKDSTCGSSSEGSYSLTSNAPMVKLKKQRTSQRTSKRKTLSSISSDEDNRGAESGNTDNTKMGKVKKRKTSQRISKRKALWRHMSTPKLSRKCLDEDKHIYKTPSLAVKQGHSLNKMADIVQCVEQMTESDNKEFLKNLERSGRYEKKWDVCVLSRALQTVKEPTLNTPQLLPFTEDVKNMHMYLEKRRGEYQSGLQNDPNKKNWSKLANLTLCEVILFNRRREGEVSKMPLSAFTLRHNSGVRSDLAVGLSKLEEKLCQHFQRIEIRGKRHRRVPILLTPDMLSSMEALVEHRRACGVPDENPFFFSRPEAETHLRGSDAIRQIARECGAKHPESLSSTKLRKHVSTLSTVLNLRDDEMDILANFLGDDMQVHGRQYYTLPEGTLQLAKVSKVLIALEQGRLSDFKGMSLDQIQIDPEEEVLEAVDSDLSQTEADSSFCSWSPVKGSSRSKRRHSTPDEFGDDSAPIGIPQTSDGPETGPPRSKRGQRTSAEPGSVEPSATGSSRSKERQRPESDNSDSETGPSTLKRKQETVESDSGDLKTENTKRRSWSFAEVQAVEKTLMAFINSGKVPGKSECIACIKASPEALKQRSWTAVKFYVKNRITAIQRESAGRIY